MIGSRLGVCWVLLAALSALLPSRAGGEPDACGVDSLVALTGLLGVSVGRERVLAALPQHRPLSLLDLRDAAGNLGMSLQGARMTVSELHQRGCAAIAHLRNPDHFMAVAAVGAEHVAVVDGGLMSLMERSVFEARSSALVLVPSGIPATGVSIRASEPISNVEFTSTGSASTRSVVLTNTGAERVELSLGEVACSCSDVTLSAKSLDAGQKAELSAKLRPRGWGTVLERVVVNTTDRACPRVVVLFRLKMPQAVLPQPDRLALRTAEGQAARRSLTLLVPEGASVTRSRAQHPFVSVSERAREPARGGIAIGYDVVVRADAPPGAFQDELTFDLDKAGVASVSVPIDGFIEADVAIHPKEAFLGMVPAGKPVRRVVVVRSASGRVFALRSIDVNDPQVAVKAECGPEAARHDLAVEVTVNGKPGTTVRDRVRVTLADGRTLEFGVFAMVAEPDTAGKE